jgi:predicted transcriptional regulator
MHKGISIAGTVLAFATVFMLASPVDAFAQGAQKNESDTDFLRRIVASLKTTERRAEKLEENIKSAGRMSKQNAMTRTDPLTTQDRYGSSNRNTTGNRDSDYRRAEMRIRTTRSQATKERERVVEMQRSGASIDPADRERIETNASRLAKEVENIQRDMQLGRF